MDILAALAVALLQLASLTFEQLRQTVDAVASALAEQYVEPAERTRLSRAGSDFGAVAHNGHVRLEAHK